MTVSTRKGRLFMLVNALHARHLSDREIGLLIGLTPQRVGQVVTLLRLEPPRFDSFAELCTWLAKEVPDLERECRYFRNENESCAGIEKAA